MTNQRVANDDGVTPFVRTDFSEMTEWEELLNQVTKENEMGFRAYIEPISDTRFDGAEPSGVARAFPGAAVVFVVDLQALQNGEILCVDGEDATAMFRVKATDLWIVENNLSAGNLLFEELLEQVGEDGVLMAPEV